MGDRLVHLQAAVEALTNEASVHVSATSPVYETEAHTRDPADDQPAFLNAVIRVEVAGSPEGLLQLVHDIESRRGRKRQTGKRWAPRPLDIDLLDVDDVTRETDDLTLPHPRLGRRRFVLRPWADIAPNHRVPPPFDASVQELLEACPDQSGIERTPYSLSVPGTSGGAA